MHTIVLASASPLIQLHPLWGPIV